MTKLLRLWRHGDPEGLQAADERAQKAQVIVESLREFRTKNHLGEHLRLTFQPKGRT